MNKEFKEKTKNWYTVRFVDKNKITDEGYLFNEYIGDLINNKIKDYVIVDNWFGQHKILKEDIIKIYKFGDTTL